jgi:hypothetical protein
MIDATTAQRLASDLMLVSVVVGGEGAEALAGVLAEAGLAAEALSGGAEAADLAILLAAPGDAGTPRMAALVASLSQASDRLLLVPQGAASGSPGMADLISWFEVFAELGYQPVVDFDAGFVGQGAFLVDRSATAAESELEAFAGRLSLGGALAASSQRVATLEAELAGGERAIQAELDALRAQHAATLRELSAVAARAMAAEAELARVREETAAHDAGWDALRAWVRAMVARTAPPSRRAGAFARLLGRRGAADPMEADLALLRASPLFDAAWYIASNPELAEAAADPVRHYLVTGAEAGGDPGPWFDSQAYLREHPELAATGENPLIHAIRSQAVAGPAR